jgi:hypothetical protein
LRITGNGSLISLSFTGLYKIIGSTRVCVGNKVISPWTPQCSCGFDEGERSVIVSFNSRFSLSPNYQLRTSINRSEPKAVNKCTVCFWGQDITTLVMSGLKQELDVAKKAIEDSFRLVDLRPHLQQVWDKLNQLYSIPKFGTIAINPKKLHMENISASSEFLNINLGITASPQITFIKPDNQKTVVPNISPAGKNNGFNVNLEAALKYDSLSNILNSYLVNKKFDLLEGIIKKHVIIKSCKLYGNEYNNLIVEIDFTGSHDGKIYLTGKPVYNTSMQRIEVENLEFDLHTNDFLLKTAKWLFNKKIVSEIKKYTVFGLENFYTTAANNIDQWLNKEWTRGIKGSGKVNEIMFTGVYALPDHLVIRSNCTGNLAVTVTEINLPL